MQLALIPYSLTRDSIPQQVADSIRSLCERFHTRLRRDLVRGKTDMKRNLLLEYSEELAVKIVKLCNEYRIDSNTVFQIKSNPKGKGVSNLVCFPVFLQALIISLGL